MTWFNSKDRSLIWEKNINLQKSGSAVVHQRLIKQYEVMGIVCALIMGSLMTLNNNDTSLFVQTTKIIGLLSSSTCVTLCLIFIVIIQWIPLGHTIIFIKRSERYMNYPLILIIISLTTLLVSILLHFERLLQIIFAPIFFLVFVCTLYIYGDIRNQVFNYILSIQEDS